MKFNKSRKEYLKQVNDAIKDSPNYVSGMTAVLADGVIVEIYQDGDKIDSIKAQTLISFAHSRIFLVKNKSKT